jgi:hypothetical protein
MNRSGEDLDLSIRMANLPFDIWRYEHSESGWLGWWTWNWKMRITNAHEGCLPTGCTNQGAAH